MWRQLKQMFDSGRCLFLAIGNHAAEIPPELSSSGQVITLHLRHIGTWAQCHRRDGTHVLCPSPAASSLSDLDQGAWNSSLPSPWGAYAVQSRGLCFVSLWAFEVGGEGTLCTVTSEDSPHALVEGAEMPVSVWGGCTHMFKSIHVLLGRRYERKGFLAMWFQHHCIFANSFPLPFLPTLGCQPLCFQSEGLSFAAISWWNSLTFFRISLFPFVYRD